MGSGANRSVARRLTGLLVPGSFWDRALVTTPFATFCAACGAALKLCRTRKPTISVGMCNRIRGLKEWREIPRDLANKPLVNFEYNPNVAPTEMVPAFLADDDKLVVARLARFGINFPPRDGKKRPPLLNARTDTLRRGSFKTMLANRRCVIPAEGFYEWREENGEEAAVFLSPQRRQTNHACWHLGYVGRQG